MHRIDTDGATVDNRFTDGNPAAGQQGTIFDAAWLNDMQESIAEAIEGAGIVLVKGSGDQLLKAILKLMLGDPTQIASPKGRIDLGGGLFVIQWGVTTIGANAAAADINVHDTFRSAFPTRCFGMVGNARGASTPGWGPLSVVFPEADLTAAGFSITVDSTDPNQHFTQSVNVFWIAVGN